MKKSLITAILIALGAGAPGQASVEVDYVGTLSQALHSPTLVAALDDGLAVMDPYAKELVLYSSDGIVSTRVIIDGQASGLCRLAPGTFLYCDRVGNTVEAIDIVGGRQYTFLSNGGGLVEPTDVLVRGDTIFVLDGAESTVRMYSRNGEPVGQTAVRNESGVPLDFASAFASSPVSGAFYIVDQTNADVTVMEEGAESYTFASYGAGVGQLTRPGDIVVSPSGAVLVTDRYQGHVQVYAADGRYIGGFARLGTNSGPLATPIGISLDGDGTVYVATPMSGSIEIFHGTFQGTTPKLVAAQPLWPPDGALVGIDELELTVQAMVETTTAMRGFEYQLFSADTAAGPVEESGMLEADSLTIVGETAAVGAAWVPTFDLAPLAAYNWRVRAVTTDTAGDWSPLWRFTVASLPGTFRLDQNFPNPFNPSTEIRFSVPVEGLVRLTVYNLLGQEVRVLVDDRLEAGEHSSFWDGTSAGGSAVSTGVYFYRLEAGGEVETRKMVLLK